MRQPQRTEGSGAPVTEVVKLKSCWSSELSFLPFFHSSLIGPYMLFVFIWNFFNVKGIILYYNFSNKQFNLDDFSSCSLLQKGKICLKGTIY